MISRRDREMLSKFEGILPTIRRVCRSWTCFLINESGTKLTSNGYSRESGRLDSALPDVNSNSEELFVWVKTNWTFTGACGVVYYKIDANRILSIMASIPFDWNMFDAWFNIRVSNKKETFDDMYNGRNGCAEPVRASTSYSAFDGDVVARLTNENAAVFNIIYKGLGHRQYLLYN